MCLYWYVLELIYTVRLFLAGLGAKDQQVADKEQELSSKDEAEDEGQDDENPEEVDDPNEDEVAEDNQDESSIGDEDPSEDTSVSQDEG